MKNLVGVKERLSGEELVISGGIGLIGLEKRFTNAFTSSPPHHFSFLAARIAYAPPSGKAAVTCFVMTYLRAAGRY